MCFTSNPSTPPSILYTNFTFCPYIYFLCNPIIHLQLKPLTLTQTWPSLRFMPVTTENNFQWLFFFFSICWNKCSSPPKPAIKSMKPNQRPHVKKLFESCTNKIIFFRFYPIVQGAFVIVAFHLFDRSIRAESLCVWICGCNVPYSEQDHDSS